MADLRSLINLIRNTYIRFAEDVELITNCSYVKIPEQKLAIVIFPPIQDLNLFNHITKTYRECKLPEDEIIEHIVSEVLNYMDGLISTERERLNKITRDTNYQVSELATGAATTYTLKDGTKINIQPAIEDSRLFDYLNYALTSDLFNNGIESIPTSDKIKKIIELITNYQVIY